MRARQISLTMILPMMMAFAACSSAPREPEAVVQVPASGEEDARKMTDQWGTSDPAAQPAAEQGKKKKRKSRKKAASAHGV